MDELELVVDGKKLKLVAEKKIWSKLYFVQDNDVTTLGANRLSEIISKLLITFLRRDNRKYFTYKEEEFFTVVNMMDPHTTIAGRKRSDVGVELVYLDKNGEIFPLFTLTTDNMEEWIRELTKFMIEYKED